MISAKRILTLCIAGLTLYAPGASAIDEDGCSIWLCLPQGFAPSSCSDAKKELFKRTLKGKSPLPDLGSCMVTPDYSVENIEVSHTYMVKERGNKTNWYESSECPDGPYMRLGMCWHKVDVQMNGNSSPYYFNQKFHDLEATFVKAGNSYHIMEKSAFDSTRDAGGIAKPELE